MLKRSPAGLQLSSVVLEAELDYGDLVGKTLITSKLCAKEENKYVFQFKSLISKSDFFENEPEYLFHPQSSHSS